MNNLKLFTKFLKYIKPYWFRETVLFSLMILASAGSLSSPFILKIVIDDIIPSGEFDHLLMLLLLMIGINIIRIVISFYTDYLYEWIGNHIVMDLRKDLFNHLIQLPISFFDNNKTGDIIHRINSEVSAVQNMLTGSLIRFINNFFTIMGLTIALCLLNWKLLLISLIVLPFIFINTKYFQPKIHDLNRIIREKDSDILNYFVERVENIRLIKNYNAYDFESKKLKSKIESLIAFNLKNVLLSSGTRNLSTFLVTLAPVMIFLWGGKAVMFGAMTLGSLVAFIQYLNRLFNPIRDFMGLYWDLIRTSVSMQRILEFSVLPIETKTNGTAVIPDISFASAERKFRYENVYFKYDGTYILKNFNQTFQNGKKYAIVGTSGCGKSTIMNLLNRFYIPQKGKILLNDTDIRLMDLYSYRKKIAFVMQETQLFHDSILENIIYCGNQYSDFEIDDAITKTGIFEQTAKLKNGLDSTIGDKGTIISGGQKQRIAIARALLKNADVIILDEATSALDSESERQIILNLFDCYREKTIIIVSHRLSAIKDVDEIICMNKGSVVESGRYSELVKMNGYFVKLFKDQMEQ